MKQKLTEGNIVKALIIYACPLIAAYTIQGCYRLINSILVAKWLGETELAAMSVVSSLTFALMNIACGYGIGAGVLIGQRFGAEKYVEMKKIIHDSIFIGLILSIMISAILIWKMDLVAEWLNVPEDTVFYVKSYLKIYLIGYIFIMLNNMMIAHFNSLGKSKIPLIINTIGALVNVVLDVIFIVIFNCGIIGAVIPLIIVQVVEVLFEFLLLHRVLGKILRSTKEADHKRHYREILRTAIPCILQYGAVSIGSVVMQGLINTFGSDIVAGYGAGVRIDDLALCILTNASTVAATFTAQNYGAKQFERIQEGIRICFHGVCLVAVVITAIVFPMRRIFISAFIGSQANELIIETGCSYLQITSVFYMMLGIMYLYQGALCGIGETGLSMVSTITNFCVRIIAANILVQYLGIYGVLVALPMGWSVGTIIAKVKFDYKKQGFIRLTSG